MEVRILPALEDNYMYLLIDKNTNEAAIIDPVEPQTVLSAVEDTGVCLTSVLTTHHHWDHAGGNEEIKNLLPHLRIYGGDQRIGALTELVKHNQKIKIGDLDVQCLYTPCHTTGHICYHVTSKDDHHGAVFTGDTLFLAGCGRFFEGTAEQMHNALNNVLSALPNPTKVFCGHEYSLQNLSFAAKVEPNNKYVHSKLAWSKDQRDQGKPTVPSTIGEEKTYNPFMRVGVDSIKKQTKSSDEIEVMQSLRDQKDHFKMKE